MIETGCKSWKCLYMYAWQLEWGQSPCSYPLGLEIRGKVSKFSQDQENLFHFLVFIFFYLLWSNSSCHKGRADWRLLITVSQPKIYMGKEQRKREGRAWGLEEEQRTAWQKVRVRFWGSFCQLIAFSGPFLLPLEAVSPLPFSHHAVVSLQPSTQFHPCYLAREVPAFPPVPGSCTGP